jgi:hypothetical protein
MLALWLGATGGPDATDGAPPETSAPRGRVADEAAFDTEGDLEGETYAEAETDDGGRGFMHALLEAPVVAEPSEPAPPPAPETLAPGEAPILVVKTLVGLLALIVLAYLGGHAKVRALEEKLGISRVVAAGFPFLLLGFIAASEPVGILSPSVVSHLRPILHLALGWLGLLVGLRVELGRLATLPRGTPMVLAIGTGLPFALIAAGCGLLLVLARASQGEPLFDETILRDAFVLGAAGAMAADTDAIRVALRRATDITRERVALLASLDEMVGLVGLIFLTAYFRPPSSWHLPATAWLFIGVGLPACVGFVVYLVVRLRSSSTEMVALLLGSVAFAAGVASTLRLSALAVCFLVGVLLANFPGDYQARLRDMLGRLEAPIYLLFLLVAGARWQPQAVLGWALVIVLLAARLPGRWIGARVAWRRAEVDLPRAARRALALSPLGILPIAIAVNAELLHPADPTLPAITAAVIAATILLEFFAQLYWRSPDREAQLDPESA